MLAARGSRPDGEPVLMLHGGPGVLELECWTDADDFHTAKPASSILPRRRCDPTNEAAALVEMARQPARLNPACGRRQAGYWPATSSPHSTMAPPTACCAVRWVMNVAAPAPCQRHPGPRSLSWPGWSIGTAHSFRSVSVPRYGRVVPARGRIHGFLIWRAGFPEIAGRRVSQIR